MNAFVSSMDGRRRANRCCTVRLYPDESWLGEMYLTGRGWCGKKAFVGFETPGKGAALWGESVRPKRLMRTLGGSVRLKRLKRTLGGSVRLKRTLGGSVRLKRPKR